MELNYSKIFNEKTMQSLSAYCSENKIEDVNLFIQRCLKQGFDIKKYGLIGETLNDDEKDLKTGIVGEKQVEIEVIREIRVEVPVEVIKEVEKIVTKIEYIRDKDSENELFGKIEQLENEMSKKDKELDEFRRNLDVKLDKTNEKMLQETLQKLRKELTEKNEKITELTKINQDLQNTREGKLGAVFLRGSNLKDII
jgi:predicted RNase H-like nuclease (RuvC/YqgF family)